jgi:hypothetical protein
MDELKHAAAIALAARRPRERSELQAVLDEWNEHAKAYQTLYRQLHSQAVSRSFRVVDLRRRVEWAPMSGDRAEARRLVKVFGRMFRWLDPGQAQGPPLKGGGSSTSPFRRR